MDNQAQSGFSGREESMLRMVADTLELERSQLDLDTDLLATERMDSLAIMAIVSFMEESMGVPVPIEAILPDNFRSVRAILALANATPQT